MVTVRKTLFGIGVLIAGFIALFIFLLRGCLSKYDERSALLPALYFEKDGKPLLFSIVQFSKAISYSQSGGFIRKSMSTSYYIQLNDGSSSAVLLHKKIKHHDDIKNYPVEVLGASKDKAWLFMGELMAFDPFTLDLVADTKLLEQNNPALAGKLPVERRYYAYHSGDSCIYFTAKDGTKWKIHSATLSIRPDENNGAASDLEKETSRIEQLEKKNQVEQDSNLAQHNRNAALLYSKQKITREQYNKSIADYFRIRDGLYKEADSIRHLRRNIEKIIREKETIDRSIENLQRTGLGYYSIKTNTDTINGKWYGLYEEKEFEKLPDYFRYSSENDETARRKLYTANLGENKSGDVVIEKDAAAVMGSEAFLHGGFLLDKTTALPVRIANNSWIMLYKDEIGRDGKILIARVSFGGKVRWSFNSQLPDWQDWIYTGKQLFIFGKDNSHLSGSNCNVLWCIDLGNGNALKYDFFTDK